MHLTQIQDTWLVLQDQAVEVVAIGETRGRLIVALSSGQVVAAMDVEGFRKVVVGREVALGMLKAAMPVEEVSDESD